MNNYEKTIQHQFDSFCKTVLRNQARNIYSENKRRSEIFISMDMLSAVELNQLSFTDTYESECICFSSFDYTISVKDFLIAQAIQSLSKKQQDVILLSFFLNMTEVDIALLMNLTKSTVHYHKDKALKK
ncbi:sigma-70 family RNA polymerase sigma factor [Enterococcus casseliflavus]|uniref:sigma-70 family RNA polymerase sigma factor n=1 Tax=Enterococcus casseliflavus TaxID=37734 RepID=UPI00403D0B89